MFKCEEVERVKARCPWIITFSAKQDEEVSGRALSHGNTVNPPKGMLRDGVVDCWNIVQCRVWKEVDAACSHDKNTPRSENNLDTSVVLRGAVKWLLGNEQPGRLNLRPSIVFVRVFEDSRSSKPPVPDLSPV